MHPNGMPVRVVCVIGCLDQLLASLQDAVLDIFRWCRGAQPSAKSLDASGIVSVTLAGSGYQAYFWEYSCWGGMVIYDFH